MIWLERAEQWKDQPSSFIVGFQGRFDEDTRTLSLWLQMFGGPERGDVEVQLWEKKVGDALNEEDITGEDIYNKYKGKISKIVEGLPKDFPALVHYFQKKLTEQSGHPVYFDYQAGRWFANSSDLPEDQQPSE